ncbi:DsbA family oxidoreductase [Pseudonocardia spinosispora]|uniref:DsbA family oxidoreductase n=1 Tax=Pseudonocardia spinosispora TaxID=103441 RepID=UPI000685391D|nr:DsbA family oxidoreductase [Pseudonocardia spinosispora]
MDIWSDVVCPWCAIGRARFEAALAGFPHQDEVTVRWHSFELDGQAPRERTGPLVEHLAAKYGMSVEDALSRHRQMTETAAADGLEFHFEKARPGNTFDAHRLLHHALETGGPQLQDRLKERLFRAYLTEGEPIGDPDTLVRVAAEVGLDADGSRAVLLSDRYADAVRADELQARRYGITSVPFFVVDEKYGVSGAQPAAALREVLDTAWAEANPSPLVTLPGAPSDDGGACTDGSCAI